MWQCKKFVILFPFRKFMTRFVKYVRENLHVALAVVFVILVTFFIGLRYGESRIPQSVLVSALDNKEANKPGAVDFSPFWKAWNILNDKYVPATTTEEITDQDKVWGAIKGLADSLGDPYTTFFPPVESEIFESDVRGNFEGVGMEIGLRDEVLTVIAPLRGTPAYEAGIKAGDKIIKIGDKSTLNISADEAITYIRGKRGTPVTFTILRNGSDDPIEITVIRDIIDIPTIERELLPNGVFVIELYNFSSVSPNLFRQALREFIVSGSDKLLLDLRGNPGGYLEASIDMASWFLPPGRVIVKEDFGAAGEGTIYRSKGYDIFNENLKFVILIDGGSASASEILAGALKEYGVAKLVGSRTFGKGSVQELIDITSDTSLKVTIAQWLTPNGVSISDGGLTPDVEVAVTKEDIDRGRDAQLEKAIEVLLSWGK